jgi:phosphoglycolate phosphatase
VSAAVIFDLDGTLADTATDIARSLNAVLMSEHRRSIDLEAVRLMIGRGPTVLIERALRHLGDPSDGATARRLSAAFVDHYATAGHPRTTLFPGMRDCLQELSNAGIGIGVCSNKPQGSCESLLSDLGIDGLVSAVQGSSPDVPAKPDPTSLYRVLRTLGANPARSLYVGDSDTDVMTARAARMPVILVGWGYSDTPVTELGADAVIDTVDDLPKIRSRLSSPRPPADSPPRRSAET